MASFNWDEETGILSVILKVHAKAEKLCVCQFGWGPAGYLENQGYATSPNPGVGDCVDGTWGSGELKYIRYLPAPKGTCDPDSSYCTGAAPAIDRDEKFVFVASDFAGAPGRHMGNYPNIPPGDIDEWSQEDPSDEVAARFAAAAQKCGIDQQGGVKNNDDLVCFVKALNTRDACVVANAIEYALINKLNKLTADWAIDCSKGTDPKTYNQLWWDPVKNPLR